MDLKHKEVLDFLNNIYGKGNVPEFERHERCIDILHSLALICKDSEETENFLTHDFSKKVHEYEVEAQVLAQQLKAINVQEEHLPSDVERLVSTMASTANALGVSVPTVPNIMASFLKLESDLNKVTEDKQCASHKLAQALKLNEELSMKLEQLERIEKEADKQSVIEKEMLDQLNKKSQFTQEKINNYTSDISYYEEKLKKVGFKSDIEHIALLSKHSRLEELKHQVKTLNDKLVTFTLPPDIDVAQCKVDEKRQQLAEIAERVIGSHPSCL